MVPVVLLLVAIVLAAGIFVLCKFSDRVLDSPAEYEALLRYVSTHEDDPMAKCNDKYAEKFINSTLRNLLRFLPPYRFLLKTFFFEKWTPGLYAEVVARNRLWDEVISSLLKNNHINGDRNSYIEQVVILNAGFGSRSLRMSSLLEAHDVNVFEVDTSPVLGRKKRTFETFMYAVPEYIHYVPFDLLASSQEGQSPSVSKSKKTDGDDNKKTKKTKKSKSQASASLLAGLKKRGFNTNCLTLFVCERVTCYMHRSEVESLFADVVKSCKRGSFVLFDFVKSAAVRREQAALGQKTDGKGASSSSSAPLEKKTPRTKPLYGYGQTTSYMETKFGQPFRSFTIDSSIRGELLDWLATRGLALVQHVPVSVLKRYAKQSDGKSLARISAYIDSVVAQTLTDEDTAVLQERVKRFKERLALEAEKKKQEEKAREAKRKQRKARTARKGKSADAKGKVGGKKNDTEENEKDQDRTAESKGKGKGKAKGRGKGKVSKKKKQKTKTSKKAQDADKEPEQKSNKKLKKKGGQGKGTKGKKKRRSKKKKEEDTSANK